MEQGRQMRFTDEELAIIRATFGGSDGGANWPLLKVLRKVFLPEYDPHAPLGQTIDLWLTLDVKQMLPEQAFTHILARNQVITHVEQQLMQLEVLAKMKEEDPIVAAQQKKKNSSK